MGPRGVKEGMVEFTPRATLETEEVALDAIAAKVTGALR